MAIQFQTARETGEWLEVENSGGPLPPGEYVLQAKEGNVEYHIDVAPPGEGQSVFTLVPLDRVPVRIDVGQTLRFRMYSKLAELHILE